MKTTIRNLVLMTFLAGFTVSIPAQRAWEKDWRKWKKEDVEKVLNDSPWAKNYSNIDVNIGYGNANRGLFDPPGIRPAPSIVLRIYSSLKVRQALLRLRQLQDKYDEMTPLQKADYDERSKVMLECENCKNYYVFSFLQLVTDRNAKSIVTLDFKDETVAGLKDKIFLVTDKKGIRELEQFGPPKNNTDAAFFYFPRFDKDKVPLVTKDTKKLKVQFKTNLFDRKGYFLQDVEFDVSKILVNGEIDL